MKIEDKKAISEKLKLKFVKASAVILTSYKGLDVKLMNLLRQKLRKIGVEYQVVKNSLLIRAANGNPVGLMEDKFVGPSAVALSYNDSISLAKTLVDFSSDHEFLKIKCGIIDNKFINVDQINLLATLPSKDILYSNLLSSMSAVPVSLVRLLKVITSNFVNVLQALKNSRE